MQLIEFGMPFEMLVVPSIGSMRDVERRRAGHPGAELFAFENPGRVVLDSLADHDFATDVHEIEHSTHRVTGRLIRFFLFAATQATAAN